MSEEKQIDLKLIPQLKDRENELKDIFENYTHCAKMFVWLRISMFAVVAVIIIYNVFFAGKSYTPSDYNTIINTIAIIMSIIIFILLLIMALLFKKQYDIRKLVKKLAISKNMIYKDLKKEINLVLKSTFGGYGI